MPHSFRCLTTGLAFLLLGSPTPVAGAPPSRTVPLTPDAWTATDSIRFVSHLGRPALYIDRGVALAREAAMENGVLELDVAATEATNFLGVAFRAASPRFSNVVFLRPGASGTEEAVQYGPAFNSVGVAWQVYHGEGANAVAELPRDRWIHVRLELDGPIARLFLDGATTPTLVVPRVVASGGAGLGVWAGAFGRGAYFSNIRYTAAPASRAASPEPTSPPGTIRDWEISSPIEAAQFYARDSSRSRPAVVGAGPGGARRVRAPQPLPGSAGGWRAAGQHRRGDGGQRDDGQDRGLAHRVRAHHAHRGARRDPAARVRLQQRRGPLSERAAGRLRHESRRASRARRHGESR